MTAVFLAFAAEQAFAGAIISNGTIALGVNDPGQLNFSDDTRFVGVTYEPTGHDGTRAGCQCEGWGAGVAATDANFSGHANNDWTPLEGINLDLISFTATASTATSVVSIDDKLKVTHDLVPSTSTPNLYEIKVTLENIGPEALPDVRYTRVMDWDVEPTELSEFVTIERGSTPAPGGNLIRSNDNGFASADPFADHSPGDPATENADYIDKGPDDHGALFDFSFGPLEIGARKEFTIFYGAAGSESNANAAVAAVGMELYTYGQADGGPEGGLPYKETGEPTTFIWGFRGVGGSPVFPPPVAPPPPPVVSTGDAAAVQNDSVTLLGSVRPGGFETSWFFEYGKTTAYGSRTPTQTIPATTDEVPVAAEVRDLDSDSTYHYRLVAQNAAGTVAGPDRVFSTRETRLSDLPPPVLGRTANVDPVKGKVFVSVPAGASASRPLMTGPLASAVVPGLKGRRFIPLSEAREVPMGSLLDTRRGTVQVVTARNRTAAVQSAKFLDGVFQVLQSRKRRAKGLTELRLKGSSFKPCRRGRRGSPRGAGVRAVSSGSRTIRRLRGSGSGRFSTRGRRSAATVRSTIWTVIDRCDGTLTKVTRGTVAVRDFRRKKTIIVRAGKSYLAR